MSIRLIGIDLDGTMLTDDKRVSKSVRQALNEASRQGALIVPVTGRPFHGLPDDVRSLDCVRFSIQSNGAMIYDWNTSSKIAEHLIKPDIDAAREILRSVARGANVLEVFSDGWGYETLESLTAFETRFLKKSEKIRKALARYARSSRRIVKDLEDILTLLTGGVENISLMYTEKSDEDRVVLEIHEKFAKLRVVSQSPGWIEIGAEDADKGMALLELATFLGIAKNEIMAIGDANNDLGMLKASAFPVAMENATEEVKNTCIYITDSNNHDGVAKAIHKLVLRCN